MEQPIQILLVDDEQQFSAMTQEYLEMKGLKVRLEHSGDSALKVFSEHEFDLCILDVKMPFMDGFTLAEELRKLDDHIPVIFLTGQRERSEKLRGLQLGADDYITKPFSMEELYLRIRNILRRVDRQDATTPAENDIQLGTYHFKPSTRELILASQSRKLTAIESQLLLLLNQHRNKVLDRELALKRIWGDDDFLRGRSLNVYVSKLRRYLTGDPSLEILNVHGVGYKLVVAQ